MGHRTGPLRLDQHICFALYSASAMLTRLYRPLLEPLNLTYPQYLAMLVLWEKCPRTVGELGEALRLDSATLTPLIKRLEAAGYVTRRRDPADERRVLIAPTPAGQALHKRAADVPHAMRCQLPIETDDLIALRSILDRLNQAEAVASKSVA
ncbi:MAG: MarR family winged helix-turn-helix transcriptional regulator [Rhizobiaceae bacterium]